MSLPAKECKSTIIPSLRYRNCHQAIDFLIAAFSFQRAGVWENPDGTVAHAQLTFGNGMVMLGTVAANELAEHLIQPDETGNRATNTPYLIVNDPAAVYDSAQAAGARILLKLEAKDYGGTGFTCADPEGHIWSIGDYDPWAS